MRARLAALLALAGALLLPASLFFHWYELSGEAGAVTMTGWQAFEFVDLLLVIVALVTIVGALGPRFGLRRWSGAVAPLAGAVAAVAVLLQIVEPPPLLSAYEEGGGVHVSREIGAWLALGGAVLLVVIGLVRAASGSRASSGG